MINQDLTLPQKLTFILDNKNKVHPIYQTALQELEHANHQDPINIIKIQTFYRALIPSFMHLNLQLAKNQNLYPISAIAAFPHPELEYLSINNKLVMWVESGGTRLIALKSNSSNQDTMKIINQTHGMVVPDCCFSNENNKNFIKNVLELSSKQVNYPLLFLGFSGILALQLISEMNIEFSFKQQKNYSEAYFNYDSQLPKNLQIPLRMTIQNKKRLPCPIRKIKPSQLNSIMKVSGIGRDKSSQFYCLSGQIKQRSIYFIFYEAWFFDNPDSIAVGHKLIGNFIQLMKTQKKTVSEKNIEKRLLAGNKLVHKGDDYKTHYKIIP